MLLSAKWIIPITSEPIEDGAILVSSDKIEKLGVKNELIESLPNEPEIDFGHAVIMPGFVNTHSHLEYSVFKGVIEPSSFTSWILQIIKRARKLSPEDWEISARLGAYLSIKSGITCLGDIVSRGPGLKALRESGLRGIGFVEVIEMDEARNDETMENLSHKVELWQGERSKSSVRVGISPHSLYTVNPPLLKRLSKWAKGEGLPVSMHLAESREETVFVRDGEGGLAREYREFLGWDCFPVRTTGLTPVRYAKQLGVLDGLIAAHCVQVDSEDIALLRKHSVAIAHCPRSNSCLRLGVAPVVDFLDHNISVGLGTDSLASNEDMEFSGEMKHIHLVRSKTKGSLQVLTPWKIIEIATLGGARVLGMENQIGSLERGKQADVIAFKLSGSIASLDDLFEYSIREANQENVIFNMVAGKILLHRDRDIQPDVGEIATEAEMVRGRLCPRG